MSLWPSISGVFLRIRSILFCTAGAMGWASDGAASEPIAAARTSLLIMVMDGRSMGQQPCAQSALVVARPAVDEGGDERRPFRHHAVRSRRGYPRPRDPPG